MLVGPSATGPIPGVARVVDEQAEGRQVTMTVRLDGPVHDPRWIVEPVGLEDLVLAYLAGSGASLATDAPTVLDVIGGRA